MRHLVVCFVREGVRRKGWQFLQGWGKASQHLFFWTRVLGIVDVSDGQGKSQTCGASLTMGQGRQQRGFFEVEGNASEKLVFLKGRVQRVGTNIFSMVEIQLSNPEGCLEGRFLGAGPIQTIPIMNIVETLYESCQ